ncbi:MAG: alpha/beta hydrolase [Chloroflexota bacterium]
MVSHHFFHTGQVKLHYAVGGNGRLPLILLHGTTNRWQGFQPVLPHLQDAFRIYALDLRGHGLSGRVAGGYRVVDFAADIVAFVQKVVGEPFLLWGHSLGGLVGIAAAPQLGSQLGGLIIEDSPLFLRRATVQKGSPRAYIFFRAVYEVMQQPRAEWAAMLADLLPPERAAVIPALVERLPFVDPDVVRMSFDSSLRDGFDMDDCLRKIESPTLLVQADAAAGGAVADEDVAAVLGLLLNGRSLRISNVGHAIHAERPSEMARIVIEFIETFNESNLSD